jgi:hypothetical protein
LSRFSALFVFIITIIYLYAYLVKGYNLKEC